MVDINLNLKQIYFEVFASLFLSVSTLIDTFYKSSEKMISE